MGAQEVWREQLASWRIPDEILARAPEPPWGFPVECFRVTDVDGEPSPTWRRVREALGANGTLLDVGCGGGTASLPHAAVARRLVAVDESADMLVEYAAAADARGATHAEVRGRWPDVSAEVPGADVAVAAHVTYNVPDLVPFACALAGHAARRVVLEMTAEHPLVATAPLWHRFYGLDRPTGPHAGLCRAVLEEAGLAVREERFERPPRPVSREVLVAFTRRRLCLPREREPEVAEALDELAPPSPRRLVTLWWDPR